MSDPTLESAKSASTSSFVTALVLNAAVCCVELLAFTVLRPRFKAVYEPRTITPVKSKRVRELSRGLLTWPIAVFKADYTDIKAVNGMDAYFFVRFLRMMCIVFFPIWLISWAVLLPTTSVHTQVPGHSGLDIFVFGNVEKSKTDRYAAHLILVWIFTFWIFYNIKREMARFITIRQQHLIAPHHASSVQATTVLIMGIPAKYLSEQALLKLYNHLPGGVKKIWLNRHLKELPEVYERHTQAANKLESAENALMQTAAKLAQKLKKDAVAAVPSRSAMPTAEMQIAETEGRPLTHRSIGDPESNLSLVERLVPQKKRPSHRLPLRFMPFALPFVGEKVDTINWARDEIVATNELLAKGRTLLNSDCSGKTIRSELPDAYSNTFNDEDGDETQLSKEYPPLNSAFITFNEQIAAHIAKTALNHHKPYRMAKRYTEVAPEDVIWGNLGINTYEAKGRMLISYAATAGLIILWAFPVAFIGIISNVHALCQQYGWLAWLCKLPSPVVGVIQGVLPPLLLAVLMMLLPIILRLLALFEGIPKKTGLELSLMSRFFIFQVIHSFLIVSISSGIIAALPGMLNSPGQIPSLLAQNLPLASTFFLTYILLTALSGTAGGFLQLATLILHYVALILLGSTPRSIYRLKYGARTVAWGTLFPSTTLLVVIGLGYSIIAPIMNGLVFAAFGLFYLLYKYLFLWVMEQPMSSDTGGLFFPKAINHIFVGLYVEQFCLAALFFLARNESGEPSAVTEGAFMVVLIACTIIFQMMIDNSYGPLIQSLPLTLAHYIGEEPTSTSDVQRKYPESSEVLGSGTEAAAAVDLEAQNPAGVGSSTNNKEIAALNMGSDDEPDITHRDPIDYGFAHPAASRPQRTIWMATDTLGLSAEEMESLQERGIDVSIADARMDAMGNVTIQGPPPDGESRS